MKIMFLILFLSFSSFAVADDHSTEWKILGEAKATSSKEVHEKLCDIMSQDISDLYMLRQNNWSLVTVLGEARQRNKELSKKVFGNDDMSDVMYRDWLDYYETSVLNIFLIVLNNPNKKKLIKKCFVEILKELFQHIRTNF